MDPFQVPDNAAFRVMLQQMKTQGEDAVAV
jgi:hypothetical protein